MARGDSWGNFFCALRVTVRTLARLVHWVVKSCWGKFGNEFFNDGPWDEILGNFGIISYIP